MPFRLPNRIHKRKTAQGQSFIELAIVLPVLLLILLGVVEVAVFIGRYLDVLDLTREAARFASVRDPFDTSVFGDYNCSTPDQFDFYYDTACIFSPPEGSPVCSVSDPFCNGLNPYVELDPETDDVIISVYTVHNHAVTNTWPQPNAYWALSNVDTHTSHNNNWQRNCQGETVRTQPYYTNARVNTFLSSTAPASKGFVAVEFYYCYEQVLGLPLVTNFIPNPLQIHAYTLMPLPAAQPSPTPKIP